MTKAFAISRRSATIQDGFTLVEMAVVVLIIGILVAIAVPSYLGASTSAKNKQAETVLRSAFTAAKIYFYQNQSRCNSYCNIGASAMSKVEPSFTYVNFTAPNKVNQVDLWFTGGHVPNGDYAPECFTTYSTAGDYFSIYDNGGTSIPPVEYLKSTSMPTACGGTGWSSSTAAAGW